jgi:hypothetical protein
MPDRPINSTAERNNDVARQCAEREAAVIGCDRLLAALRRRHKHGTGELRIKSNTYVRRIA